MVSFFHTSSLFSSSSLLAQPGLEREVQQGGQPSGLRERRQVPQYLLDTCLKYTLSTVQRSSGVLISLIGSLIWTSYTFLIFPLWSGYVNRVKPHYGTISLQIVVDLDYIPDRPLCHFYQQWYFRTIAQNHKMRWTYSSKLTHTWQWWLFLDVDKSTQQC